MSPRIVAVPPWPEERPSNLADVAIDFRGDEWPPPPDYAEPGRDLWNGQPFERTTSPPGVFATVAVPKPECPGCGAMFQHKPGCSIVAADALAARLREVVGPLTAARVEWQDADGHTGWWNWTPT